MADVFIAQTRPEVMSDEWPPKPKAPLSNDKQTFFPKTGTEQPVANSQSAVIHQGPQPDQPGQPVQSVEARFVPAPQPISNDSHAAIFTRPSGGSKAPAERPPSKDVQFLGAGAPISNDRGAAIIHYNAPPEPPAQVSDPWVEPITDVQPQPGTTISNERNTNFVRSSLPLHSVPGLSPDMTPQGARYIPSSPIPMNVSGDTFIAPAAGLVQGGAGYNPDSQILPRGGVINVDNDRTLGGGGDTTKMAGSESVVFGSRGAPIEVGGTEAIQAKSGDTTQPAGHQDVLMAPSAGNIGNQESYNGAQGDPIANKDFNDYVPGAIGKPLKRNVS